jgi:hypothetical protein
VQPLAQEAGEEVMVTVPAPPVVERDHEQVHSLQLLKHRLPLPATRHGITQRTV